MIIKNFINPYIIFNHLYDKFLKGNKSLNINLFNLHYIDYLREI